MCALYLAFSRFGRIRLGRDERPAFRTSSWVAMMFSAGMGIGLMFYGVAEPLAFYTQPPPGSVLPGDQVEALRTAMATSLSHGDAALVGDLRSGRPGHRLLDLRKGRKQHISSAFAPLIGQRLADGWLGKVIDIIAIFATVFGSAASLGLGALQIGGGLEATGVLTSVGNGLLVPMGRGPDRHVSALHGRGGRRDAPGRRRARPRRFESLTILVAAPFVIIMVLCACRSSAISTATLSCFGSRRPPQSSSRPSGRGPAPSATTSPCGWRRFPALAHGVGAGDREETSAVSGDAACRTRRATDDPAREGGTLSDAA